VLPARVAKPGIFRRCSIDPDPLATYFKHMEHENTAKSRAILVEVNQITHALGLDDESLDELMVGLGLD
jgi:hypothetical protein